eukprot:g34561.t1
MGLCWASPQGRVSMLGVPWACAGLHLEAGCLCWESCGPVLGFTSRPGVCAGNPGGLCWASPQGRVSVLGVLRACAGLHFEAGCPCWESCRPVLSFTSRPGVRAGRLAGRCWSSPQGWESCGPVLGFTSMPGVSAGRPAGWCWASPRGWVSVRGVPWACAGLHLEARCPCWESHGPVLGSTSRPGVCAG